MKLGKGKINFRIKFIYEMTNHITIKNVYANNLEEALELFKKAYKDINDIRILNIYEVYKIPLEEQHKRNAEIINKKLGEM